MVTPTRTPCEQGVDGGGHGADHAGMDTSAQGIGKSHAVAVLGFSGFERDVLASGFRLAAATRQPAYRLVDQLAQAEFIVADAEQSHFADELRRGRRLRDAVFIGAAAPAGVGGWTMRPIDPLHVLRALDLLAARTDEDGPPTWPGALAPAGLAPAGVTPDHGSALRRRDDGAAVEAASPAAHPVQPPLPVLPAAHPVDALLIDIGSLRGCERLLQGLGLKTRRIAGDAQTLALVTELPSDFVFIDATTADAFDALALCQQIKHGATTAGAPTPTVVLVSTDVSASDRVRGELAGCDAWLRNPPDLAELHATLQRHGARVAPLEGTRRRR